MITAVLLATAAADDGGPAAALPWGDGTVIARLLAQLAGLGVGSAHVITRPGWEPALQPALEGLEPAPTLHISTGAAGDLTKIAALARGDEGDLLVVSADVVTHREALAGLVGDARIATAALCASREIPGTLAPAVREPQGRIVSAGSTYHSVHAANVSFLGIVKVTAAHRDTLAEAAVGLAAMKELAGSDDAGALVLVGLVRSGVPVSAVQLREMFWARPASRPAAARVAREIDALDEDRLLLDSSVKANDSFFTTFLVSPYSKHIARWAARRGWTPNQITAASLGIGMLAATAFATGERAGLIAGAILLQISFTTDCVDGQLARYTRAFSRLGAWLDAIFDRTKEYAVYAGLAIGAARAGDPVWVLAGSALAVQTVRHAIDFSYLLVEREWLQAARPPSLEHAGDRPVSAAGPARGPSAAWDRRTRSSAIGWAKQFIAFPIGERFAAISITAAVASARTTFVVLLIWGGVATAYKIVGRVTRSVLR